MYVRTILGVFCIASLVFGGVKGNDGAYTMHTSGGLAIPVEISTGGGVLQLNPPNGEEFTWDSTEGRYVRTVSTNPPFYKSIELSVPPYSYTSYVGASYPGNNPADSGTLTQP